MNNEEISNILKQFSSTMNNSSTDGIKEFLNSLNSSTDNLSNSESTSSNDESTDNSINIEMLLKIKSILNQVNSKDNPRSKLLLSLKPYLNDHRKENLQKYVNFLNLAKAIEIFYEVGGDKNS